MPTCQGRSPWQENLLGPAQNAKIRAASQKIARREEGPLHLISRNLEILDADFDDVSAGRSSS